MARKKRIIKNDIREKSLGKWEIKKNLPKMKSVKDLRKYKVEVSNIPEPLEATFEDMMETNELYYYASVVLDNLFENLEPTRISHDIIRRISTEFERQIYMLVGDSLVSTTVISTFLGMYSGKDWRRKQNKINIRDRYREKVWGQRDRHYKV